jgi:hypothetical protein
VLDVPRREDPMPDSRRGDHRQPSRSLRESHVPHHGDLGTAGRLKGEGHRHLPSWSEQKL